MKYHIKIKKGLTMAQKGILTVISGFSGAGKGTLMKALLEKYEYSLSISATTRKPRSGEKHGREYFFLTREEFESMIEKGQLIEWAQYVGNYYGTPRSYVEEQLDQGKNVILEIEIQGALQVKKLFPEALLLFVTPPTAKELKRRLVGRGTEDIATIEKRMKRAAEESIYMNQYDYLVINDKLEECVEDTNTIIKKISKKDTVFKVNGGAIKENQPFVEQIEKELQNL